MSVFLVVIGRQSHAITIDTVPVGDVGNPNDPEDGDNLQSGLHQPGIQNYGRVDYAYRIGTYEVTVGQYTAFLNAVAATDTYSLYNTQMARQPAFAGISRTGASGNYSYSAIGSPNKPVTYANWGDAARFANWLHNGQPTGAQNASTTENGSYGLNGAVSGPALSAILRSADATWVIPTENEWYKAAYYQPATAGGDADNYWAYPTRTNVEPNSDQPPGDPSIQTNVANFIRDDGIANGYNDGIAVTGSTTVVNGQNYLTDVGAYTHSNGFYGTYDQGGNAPEWTESAGYVVGDRVIRGGDAGSTSITLHSSSRTNFGPDLDGPSGFRVALVPEPSSFILAAIGLIWLVVRHRRKR
jgi:sulfatase modifying factor 1